MPMPELRHSDYLIGQGLPSSMFGATMEGATKSGTSWSALSRSLGRARVHGIRMLVSVILSFVTIFATRAPQIFKRPGRPRAFFVFKDESRDQ
jgi:hypothetical protein